jgi:hypothetical protein
MLTLADGRTRVDMTLTEPDGYDVGDGPLEVPIADVAALIDTCGQINKPDFRMSATASDTVPDQALCEEGNGTAFGASNFEGTMTVLRQTDADGNPDPLLDTVYVAVGEKGTTAWYFVRKGPKAKVPLAVGDTGWIWEWSSDEPQEPTDQAGYIKNTIPLAFKSRRRFEIVA